jgi:Glycoside hydrolase family 44
VTAGRGRRRPVAAVFLAGLVAAGCSGSSQEQDIQLGTQPASTAVPSPADGTGTAGAAPATSTVPVRADVTVSIDAAAPGATISPAILGVSSSLKGAELTPAGITLDSWGGNPATRYNYDIGHAWNGAADSEFRNTNYGSKSPDAAGDFVRDAKSAGLQSRLAIPTLGWVAKDDDTNHCSFPSNGGCLPASEAGRCKDPKHQADPTTANVPSTPAKVSAWLHRMAASGATPDFVAMDNEPDLWGDTHYDVHPKCPTYEEILDKYLTYAVVAKAAFPSAALTGPALCCWYDYWNIAPGPADGSGEDFLSWFLDGVKRHDDQSGQRSIDYLDVHFYPQTGVFNDNDDPDTNAKRLRSTRALWDPGYKDESWIDQRIEFIPRMRRTIAEHYPGTKLFISEWNFGNDKKINGALAIADVLGIYGREGVEAASYWRNPDVGSPGWFAFTMHGDYDGHGSRFGGASVPAVASDATGIGSYAALDPDSGVLRVMLVNRDPEKATTVALDTKGFTAAGPVKRYTYGPGDLSRIVADEVPAGHAIPLAASSITVLELAPG